MVHPQRRKLPSRMALQFLVAGGAMLFGVPPARAIDGGTLQVTPRNGWKAFEVISVGNNPAGDGFTWSMPATFDGLGAWRPDGVTLRLLVNHENADATISEVDLNLSGFQTAISTMMTAVNTGGGSFVTSARQAYGRWSNTAGSTWSTTSDISTTSFGRFCSGQFYAANTYGTGRGFVDPLYMTGEEISSGRLFALDLENRDFYQLSGVTGTAPGGLGGMPADSWENAALVDTGETGHVALLLSPDGGTQNMRMYIGVKGKDASGAAANDFLSRNGLAYGSTYFLNDTLPVSGTSTDGFFDTTSDGALNATKHEDVDTNPNDPTQVVLGNQDNGLFAFDFALDFSSGSFNAAGSSFSLTKILNHADDIDGLFGDADNVDWTAATTLGSSAYPNGLIFVNEDSTTGNGETWMVRPDGTGLTLIADTIGISAATETSGILDISSLVGYLPGSVLLTSNQGATASLSVLINPGAMLVPEPSACAIAAFGLLGLGVSLWRRR